MKTLKLIRPDWSKAAHCIECEHDFTAELDDEVVACPKCHMPAVDLSEFEMWGEPSEL